MRIFYRETTASTNLDARDGADGDVYAAGFQTAGRGRLDHAWHASPGENLMFSAVVDVSALDCAHVVTLPLVAGLAVIQALGEICVRSGHPAVRDGLRLKWPNDVYCGGRKMCGILCERHGDRVIAGIGVNVNETHFPDELKDRVTSLAAVLGVAFDPQKILPLFAETFFNHVARWRAAGFDAFYADCRKVDFLRGRHVAVLRTDEDVTPVTGLCGGILPDGALDVAGEAVYAGEAHVTAVGEDP